MIAFCIPPEKDPGEISGTMVFGNSMWLANALNRSVSDLQSGGYTPAALLELNQRFSV